MAQKIIHNGLLLTRPRPHRCGFPDATFSATPLHCSLWRSKGSCRLGIRPVLHSSVSSSRLWPRLRTHIPSSPSWRAAGKTSTSGWSWPWTQRCKLHAKGDRGVSGAAQTSSCCCERSFGRSNLHSWINYWNQNIYLNTIMLRFVHISH